MQSLISMQKYNKVILLAKFGCCPLTLKMSLITETIELILAWRADWTHI